MIGLKSLSSESNYVLLWWATFDKIKEN